MKIIRWFDILDYEHDIIQRAMDVLQRELHRVVNNQHQTRVLFCIVDFLITFGSEIHNKKEDNILFPILKNHKSIDQHQIQITSREHASGKDILLSLFDEIGELKKRTNTYRKVYKQKGTDYLKSRFDHIWKENDIIYSSGREVVSDEENRIIIKAFEEINQSVQDGDYYKNALQMLENMEIGKCPEYKSRRMVLSI